MTRRKPIELLLDYSLHIAIILLAVCCALLKPEFITIAPPDIINRTAAYIIMALAMGCVMRVGELDLSQGRIMGLAALFGALVLVNKTALNIDIPAINPFLMVALVTLIAVIFGAGIGFINGFVTTKLRAPSWLATLAMRLVLYGLMLILFSRPFYTWSESKPIILPEFKNLVTNTVRIGGWAIPNYVWFAIGITVIVGLIWYLTGLGINMKAVGENRASAEAQGISVSWTIILAFVIAGVLCGISGIFEAARISMPGTGLGAYAEFEAITACLLGGFSFRGGKGNVFGLVIGVVLVQIVGVCLSQLGTPTDLVNIIKGVLIIIAAALSINRDLREKRRAAAVSAPQEGDAEFDTQETDPAAC